SAVLPVGRPRLAIDTTRPRPVPVYPGPSVAAWRCSHTRPTQGPPGDMPRRSAGSPRKTATCCGRARRVQRRSCVPWVSLREDPYLLTIADQFAADGDDAIGGSHSARDFNRAADRLASRALWRRHVAFPPALFEPEDREAPRAIGRLHNRAQGDYELRAGDGDRTQRQRANHPGPNPMPGIRQGNLDRKDM